MGAQPSDSPAGTFFPSTQLSWIEQQLAEEGGGRDEVNHHIMLVYAEPLERQVRRSRYRSLGAPAELVEGFFADRLEDPQFLRGWQHSGRRLRHWLRTGLDFFLKELAASSRRDARHCELSFEPADEEGPDLAVDRDFALSVVRRALQLARSELERQGHAAHYTIFYEHHAEGVPYAQLAARLGVGAERAQVMGRTGREAFRRALRLIVGRDCGRLEDVDGEVERLMEALER